MMNVSPASLRPMTATQSKAAALSAYDAACANPAGADWRTVADMLRAALPASRAKAADASAVGSVPSWWADWKLGKVYSLDSLEVLFSDGVRVRCNLAQAPRKLPRIAAACRVAIAFYRARTGRDSVPAFAHVENVSDGSTFDAATCSRLTVDLRRTAVVEAPQRVVTVEAVERMERELERRRAGLARVAAGESNFTSADADAWRDAVVAGEQELARMRAECGGCAPIEEAEAPTATESETPADLTTGEPAQKIKLAENACLPADHIEAMAICPAVQKPCKVDCPFRSGCGPWRPSVSCRLLSRPQSPLAP